MAGQVTIVQKLQEIAGRRFVLCGKAWWGRQIWNWFVCIEGGALKSCRKESGVPMVRPYLWNAAGIGNRHERRQILILGSQRITHPGAHTRKPVQNETRAHLILGRT